MIIVPELQLVVILVPRTGSGSLRRAVQKKYPQSMLIYRHMEADGVPQGYDMWPKIGVVRHPIDRLWSLYKFCKNFDGDYPNTNYRNAMRASCALPFNEWLIENKTVFTHGWDTGYTTDYYPVNTVRHALPENRKSQLVYLRPDLGTQIYFFEELEQLARRLKIEMKPHNATKQEPPPELSLNVRKELAHNLKWDFHMYHKLYTTGV